MGTAQDRMQDRMQNRQLDRPLDRTRQAASSHPSPPEGAAPDQDAARRSAAAIRAARSKEAAKKLGQLLVETGHITGEQLIRAIQSQRAVGGRLGTCLLEMDVLSEDQLLEALSDQLHVPAIRIEQLRGIEDETLELIPEKVARRCCAVPFHADRHEIQVATLDVHNLAHLDELRFCSNRRVRPHIANEVRVFEALEKYYGHEIPRRYGHLLDRLNRSRYLWDESVRVLLDEDDGPIDRHAVSAEPAPQDAPDDGRTGIAGIDDQRGDSAIRWASADEAFGDLLMHAPSGSSSSAASSKASSSTASAAAAVPTAAALPAIAPGDAPLSLAAVDQLFSHELDLSGVAEVLLRFARQHFDRVALFKIRGGFAEGWRIEAPGARTERFRALRVDLRSPSAFVQLGQGGRLFRGPLAPMPAHRRLADCWGGELPRDCLLVPIHVRDRMVMALYGDCGARGLEDLDVEDFTRLAHKASMALELCILRKKIRNA